MGLFGRKKPKPNKPSTLFEDENLSAQGNRPLRYPKLFKGAPLDVLDEYGNLIFSGRLMAFSSYELRIERLPNQLAFPELQKGVIVGIRGYTDETEPFELHCVVKQSSRILFSVEHLTLVDANNRRGSFRQPIGMPAEVFDVDGRKSDFSQPCFLIDISMTGACISSEYVYMEGQEMRLRVELYKNAGCISFTSQVVWAKQLDDGKFKYGLLFAQLPAQKARYLEEDIKAVQNMAKYKANR